MDSQSQREKRRIAHVGGISAEVVDDGLDFMSKIIKDMDSQMLHSNAIDSLYRTQDETLNKDPTLSNELVSAGSSKRGLPPRMKVPKPPKKFLPEKKHPLMEKCQRNLKYLKHNRSIPKQRAHVGYIPKSPNVNIKEKQNKFFPKEKKCSKLEKKRNTYHQSCNKEKAISDHLDTKEIAVDNDSDADFESFIREVKETKTESDETDSDSYKTSKNQKKRKKRKCAKKGKNLKSTKNNKTASKCKNTSLVTDMCNSGFKRSNEHFPTSNLSLLEKLKDHDSDDAANLILDSDQLSSTESKSPITLNHKNNLAKEIALTDCNIENSMNVLPLTFNLHSEEFKKHIMKRFTCCVRIKRDPILDKRVKSVTTCDPSISTMIRTSESIDRCDDTDKVNDPEVIVLENSTDSDDCQIIYEAPKPNVPQANTTVRLNEGNCMKSLNLPISSSHLPISMCNKLPTETSNNCLTVDGNSEFNIQILTVQTLSDPNNLIPVDSFQNNTNINLNNNSPFNSTSITCGKNREISKVNEEIISNTSKVLIPNLDDLLSKINFDLVKKICDQSNDSSVDNKDYASCIDKRLDTAVHYDTDNKNFSEENPLPEKELKMEIKRKNSLYELRTCDVLQSDWKNNYDSNALNAVSDTNYNISPDLLYNDISGNNVQYTCKAGNKIDFKEASSIENASGKINLCRSRTSYSENMCDLKKIHKSSDILENDLKFDLSKQSLQQILKDAVELSACDPNYMSHNSRIIKCDTLPNTQTIPAFACKRKINFVNQNHTTCSNPVLHSSSTRLPMNSHSVNESKLYEVNLHKRKQLYQNVSDELDAIAMTNIRELCEQRHDLLPLLNLYDKELKQYDKIVSAEMNVYTGLNVVVENQIKRIKHIEAAILNFVHHDPCFHKIKEEYLEKQCMLNNKSHSVDENVCEVQHQKSTLCSTSKISNEEISLKNAYQVNKKQQVWKCDNCGKEAKFRCQQCLKVFYCSSECGIQYWENVHNVDCS